MSLLSRPHVPPLYAPGSAPTDTSAPWEPADAGPSIPFPTWELDSRDAVGSPTMTSWPLRRTGGTLTTLSPLSGQEPQVGSGITRNGIAGVLFPTTAARASGGAAASLYSGSSDKWTIGIVCAPDEAFTNDVNCGRVFSIENNSLNAYDHGIVHGSSVPLGGGASTQHNTGIQWPSGPTTQLVRAVTGAAASNAPQVVMFTYDSGILTIERDGVSLGSRTDASRALAWVDAYIGAGGGAGPITVSSGHYPWKGTLWRVCGWVGGTLTAAQRASWMASRAAEYAISAPTWTPASATGGSAWWDSRDKYVGSGLWLGAATMDEWSSQLDADLQSHAWTNHTAGTNPAEGPRVNGYATLRFDGTNDFMQNQVATAAGIITAGAFEIYMRVIVRGISASANKAPGSGAVYTNALLCGDNNGFVGLMLRDAGSSQVYAQAFVYNGSAENAVQSAAFNLNTEVTLSMRSDGTNLRVGVNGTETTFAGTVGSVSNLTNPFNIGRSGIGGTPGIAAQFDLREMFVANATLSESDRTNLLTWLART